MPMTTNQKHIVTVSDSKKITGYTLSSHKIAGLPVYIESKILRFPFTDVTNIESKLKDSTYVYVITKVDLSETNPTYPDEPTHQVWVAEGYYITSEIYIVGTSETSDYWVIQQFTMPIDDVKFHNHLRIFN